MIQIKQTVTRVDQDKDCGEKDKDKVERFVMNQVGRQCREGILGEVGESQDGEIVGGGKSNVVYFDEELCIIWQKLPPILYPSLQTIQLSQISQQSTKYTKIIHYLLQNLKKQPQSFSNFPTLTPKLMKIKLNQTSHKTKSKSSSLLQLSRNILKQSIKGVLHFNQCKLIDTSVPSGNNDYVGYKLSGQLAQVLSGILVLTCQSLLLNHNYNSKILHRIQNILFPYIHTLNLQQNQISSIQQLTNLHAPNLHTLYLNNNKITNLRSLVRITNRFRNLTNLYLFDNLVVECRDGYGRNFMAKCMLGSLAKLKLELFKTSRVFCQDLAWLVKCDIEEEYDVEHRRQQLELGLLKGTQQQYSQQDKTFKYLQIESKKRIGIHTRQLTNTLKKRYPLLKIKTNIILPHAARFDPFNF